MWGVQEEGADIDMLFAPGNDAMTLDSIVFHNNGYYLPYDYYTEETTSCYVYYNRTIYNLIIMKTKAYFDKWVYATNMMSHYVKTIPGFIDRIKDKEKRVLLFEKYKERWEEENKC